MTENNIELAQAPGNDAALGAALEAAKAVAETFQNDLNGNPEALQAVTQAVQQALVGSGMTGDQARQIAQALLSSIQSGVDFQGLVGDPAVFSAIATQAMQGDANGQGQADTLPGSGPSGDTGTQAADTQTSDTSNTFQGQADNSADSSDPFKQNADTQDGPTTLQRSEVTGLTNDNFQQDDAPERTSLTDDTFGGGGNTELTTLTDNKFEFNNDGLEKEIVKEDIVTPEETTTTATITTSPDTIVVFDLIAGTNSTHSNRTFSADVNYHIYIKVDSNSVTVTNPGTKWQGSANLGDGDTITLVGDGSAIVGNINNAGITRTASNADSVTWFTAAGNNKAVEWYDSFSTFIRKVNGATDQVAPFTDTNTNIARVAYSNATTLPASAATQVLS